MAKTQKKKMSANETRSAAFETMTAATKRMATKYTARFAKTTSERVMAHYAFAKDLVSILADEEKYGASADVQLAVYLAVDGGTKGLAMLRRWHDTVDEETVRSYTTRPMANGAYLTVEHWLAIVKIKDASERQRLLDQTVAEGLSSRDLARRVRGADSSKNHRPGAGRPVQSSGDAYSDVVKGTGLLRAAKNWLASPAMDGVVEAFETGEPKVIAKLISATKLMVAEANELRNGMGQMMTKIKEVSAKLKMRRGTAPAEEPVKPSRAAPQSAPPEEGRRRRRSTVPIDE